MIAGNLSHFSLSTLPSPFRQILSSAGVTLHELNAQPDGRYQNQGDEWFYTITTVMTSPHAERHSEFHHDYLDIQLILKGEEIIGYGLTDARNTPAIEKKPDLFILLDPQLPHQLHLTAGDYIIFYPGEPHQALCAVNDQPAVVKKAVFKIPETMLSQL